MGPSGSEGSGASHGSDAASAPRDAPPAGFTPADELRHEDAAVEEWWFSCWSPDGALGLASGWRIVGSVGWYWASLARRGLPLVHMTEWSVPRRADPLIAKAPEMWAELDCVAPFDQWTVGNELYAIALDDPDAALGREHGDLTPFAMDLEWYATAQARVPAGRRAESVYVQDGVVHGRIELAEGPTDLVEVPARRWHRWGSTLGAPPLDEVTAHLGLRAPTRFPDGTVTDLVLSPSGWARRARSL